MSFSPCLCHFTPPPSSAAFRVLDRLDAQIVELEALAVQAAEVGADEALLESTKEQAATARVQHTEQQEVEEARVAKMEADAAKRARKAKKGKKGKKK